MCKKVHGEGSDSSAKAKLYWSCAYKAKAGILQKESVWAIAAKMPLEALRPENLRGLPTCCAFERLRQRGWISCQRYVRVAVWAEHPNFMYGIHFLKSQALGNSSFNGGRVTAERPRL